MRQYGSLTESLPVGFFWLFKFIEKEDMYLGFGTGGVGTVGVGTVPEVAFQPRLQNKNIVSLY